MFLRRVHLIFSYNLIGRCDYFGCGFATLNRNALQPLQSERYYRIMPLLRVHAKALTQICCIRYALERCMGLDKGEGGHLFIEKVIILEFKKTWRPPPLQHQDDAGVGPFPP